MNYKSRFKLEQEQHCLNAKTLCNYLKTELLMINDFDRFDHYSNQLDKIISQLDEIYWGL